VAQVQTQGTVTYTLSWEEWNDGTGITGSPTEWLNPVPGNRGVVVGAVEPWAGESALFKLTMSLSGAPAGGGAGSPLTWNPAITTLPPGSSGAGTLAGLWNGDINVVGGENTGSFSNESTFFGSAVRRRFLTFTAGSGGYVNGDPNGTGPSDRIVDIQPAQFTPDAEDLNHANNVVVWQALWRPASTPFIRYVAWNAVLGSLGFLSQVAARDTQYDAGYPYPVPLNVQTLFGSVTVPVWNLPSPGTVAVACVGLGATASRRRKRGRSG
jgi:hypothetical protein